MFIRRQLSVGDTVSLVSKVCDMKKLRDIVSLATRRASQAVDKLFIIFVLFMHCIALHYCIIVTTVEGIHPPTSVVCCNNSNHLVYSLNSLIESNMSSKHRLTRSFRTISAASYAVSTTHILSRLNFSNFNAGCYFSLRHFCRHLVMLLF
jgi:hypothetical protein